MSNQEKRIEILTKLELRNVLKRLTTEILEEIDEPKNTILMGIPTRGVYLSEVLAKTSDKYTPLVGIPISIVFLGSSISSRISVVNLFKTFLNSSFVSISILFS